MCGCMGDFKMMDSSKKAEEKDVEWTNAEKAGLTKDMQAKVVPMSDRARKRQEMLKRQEASRARSASAKPGEAMLGEDVEPVTRSTGKSGANTAR